MLCTNQRITIFQLFFRGIFVLIPINLQILTSIMSNLNLITHTLIFLFTSKTDHALRVVINDKFLLAYVGH